MELPSANTSEKRLSPPFCNLPPLWCCSKASSLPLQYPPRVWQLRVGLPEDTISFFEEFGRMDIEDLQWNMHNLFRLIASPSLKLAVFWVRVLEIKRPKKLDKLSENMAAHHHDIFSRAAHNRQSVCLYQRVHMSQYFQKHMKGTCTQNQYKT